MTNVVNINSSSYDIYIGRSRKGEGFNKWCNPFVIGRDGNREEVINKYKKYLEMQIKIGNITISELISLNNKKLGCFCFPLKCHGNIICEYVDLAINNKIKF